MIRAYRIYPLNIKAGDVEYIIPTSTAMNTVEAARETLKAGDIYMTLNNSGREIDFKKVFASVIRFYIANGFINADIKEHHWAPTPIWHQPPDTMNIRIMGDVKFSGDMTEVTKLDILYLNVPSDPSEVKHSKFVGMRRQWTPSVFI